MKALVFLLILFNLLFYAFTQGYFGQGEHPDAGRIEKQVLAEGMRIVSRGEVPAVQAKAPEPELEPAKPEIAPEPPQPEVVNKSATVEPACFAWAPLSVAEVDQLNALLERKFAEFKLTRQIVAGEANGWWVFIPPLPGKAELDKKAGEIRQLGITDYFVILEGPNRFAISLGVYSSEKGGQERLAEVKEKGVRSARLAPRPSKDGTVNVQVNGPAGGKSALLEAVSKVLPKAELRDCN